MILKQPILEFRGEHAFLSNFYPSPFKWKGLMWDTVEHAYQAAKAKHEKDFIHIHDLETPGQAKREGRRIEIREDWETVKVTMMTFFVALKFLTHEDLRVKLSATYPSHLEEGNHWNDRFWGVSPTGSGNGQNHLGNILMQIRDNPLMKSGE